MSDNYAYELLLKDIPCNIQANMTFTANKQKITLPLYRNSDREIRDILQGNKGGSKYFDDFYQAQYIKWTSDTQPIYVVSEPRIGKGVNKSSNSSSGSKKSSSSSASSSSSTRSNSSSKKPSKATKPSKPSKPSTSTSTNKIKHKVVKGILKAYPLNLFNFKNRDECKSSSRSKSYYINKTDLINTIKNDDRLAASFPKGLAKLSKDAICNILFDTKW